MQVFTSTCNIIVCNRAFFVPSAIFLDNNRLVAPVQFKMCPNLECHKYSMTLGWGLWTWHGVSVGLCLARSLWKIQSSKRVALFGNKMSHISLISINWSLDFSLAPYQLDQMVGTQGHYISCCGCAVWPTLCHSTCNLLNPTQSAWVDVSTGPSYNLCNYLGAKTLWFWKWPLPTEASQK